MSVFDFVHKFMLFIVPGAISLIIYCYIAGDNSSSTYLKWVYVFILSSISFLLGNCILFLLNLLPCISLRYADVGELLAGSTPSIYDESFLTAILCSILLGGILTWIHSNNLVFRVAQSCGLTARNNNNDVWDGLFDEEPWIVFRDYVTGYTYYGRAKLLSDRTSDMREVLLIEASVFNKEDESYKMDKIYLCRKPSEFSIEITDYKKEVEKDEH